MPNNTKIYLTNIDNIRKAVTVFLILFNCSIALAQKSSYHLDTVLYFEEIPIKYNSISRIVSTKSSEDLFYMAYINENQFYLYTYNYSKKELKKNNFKLKSNHPSETKPYDFVVNGNYVYILLDKVVHCLSKEKMKEVSSFYCGNAEYLFTSGQHIITGFYYNYHPASSPYKAGLRKFNLQGIQEDSIFLNIPFPEYCHYLPRNLITFNGEKYVLPSFNGMSFFFIDKGFERIDTLIFPVEKYDNKWVYPSVSLSESIAKNIDDLSLYWGLLDNSNSKKISRIEHVEFIDSNNLLVRWFSHDSQVRYSNRYLMNIKNISGIWHPQEKDTYIETPLPFDTKLNIYEGGMPLLSNNYLTRYSEKLIYQMKIDIQYIESLPYKDYFEKKKEMEKILEPIVSLWIFKYE
jgi:hypothetical protein